MVQKWNLNDIRPAGPKRQPPVRDFVEHAKAKQDISARVQKNEEPQQTFDDSDLETIDIIDGNNFKKNRVVITTGIIGVIVVLGFFVNVLLGGATVTVFPKVKDISVQSDFTVFTKPQTGELGYELLSLEASGERQVKASGKEKVSERAQGKIFVYNTKAGASQRLIKNTRFESKNGLIYRIKESIEVPGASKGANGEVTPGSVVAEVFADSTGEQYNIAPGKFTVPGLKGSEQFESIYGESTVPFTGGFEGDKYIIDDAELSTAQQALHLELRDKLLERFSNEVPAGFVAFKDAVTFVYEPLPATEYGDSLATLKVKAHLNAPIFEKKELAKYLAEKSVPDYKNEDVELFDPTTLTFGYSDAETALSDISASSSVDITLKGSTRLVWLFDETKLISELLGIRKNDATTVFGSYPSISHAQAEVRPFWSNSFPDSAKNIKVITTIE